VKHPPHERIRGPSARRLKITPQCRSVSVRSGDVGRCHRISSGPTPEQRPPVTIDSLAEVPLTVLFFTGLANFMGDYLPNSSFVAITAVPEPSTLVLAAFGTVLTAWAARSRRQNEPVHLSA